MEKRKKSQRLAKIGKLMDCSIDELMGNPEVEQMEEWDSFDWECKVENFEMESVPCFCDPEMDLIELFD